MYVFWRGFLGLFLRRRCTVTLNNGRKIVWTRPKGTSVADYRGLVEEWRADGGKRIKLNSWDHQIVITARDIVSLEVY